MTIETATVTAGGNAVEAECSVSEEVRIIVRPSPCE
jgi:putative (di)nucleoside polyphosphate hydrolase